MSLIANRTVTGLKWTVMMAHVPFNNHYKWTSRGLVNMGHILGTGLRASWKIGTVK